MPVPFLLTACHISSAARLASASAAASCASTCCCHVLPAGSSGSRPSHHAGLLHGCSVLGPLVLTLPPAGAASEDGPAGAAFTAVGTAAKRLLVAFLAVAVGPAGGLTAEGFAAELLMSPNARRAGLSSCCLLVLASPSLCWPLLAMLALMVPKALRALFRAEPCLTGCKGALGFNWVVPATVLFSSFRAGACTCTPAMLLLCCQLAVGGSARCCQR